MAKDPAFLFYSEKFLTGVLTMNFEDRGKYITILALMHQQGRMNEETIRFLVGSISDNLRNKFKVDEQGNWYNEKLEEEAEKRKKFAESRKENGKKGGRKPNAEPNGLPKENLSININIDKDINTDSNSFGKSENLLNGEQIVPTMARAWYEKFPTYTRDQKKDFEAIGAIVSFMVKQHSIKDITDSETKLMILETFNAIANEVSKEVFWINKSLGSIANNIQEFYNRIKNPVKNGKSKNPVDTRADLQAAIDKRFGSGQ